jgi:hypothetical protein
MKLLLVYVDVIAELQQHLTTGVRIYIHLVEKYEEGGITENIQVTCTREIRVINMYVQAMDRAQGSEGI